MKKSINEMVMEMFSGNVGPSSDASAAAPIGGTSPILTDINTKIRKAKKRRKNNET